MIAATLPTPAPDPRSQVEQLATDVVTPVPITGIGLVTPLGDDPGGLAQALAEGRSAIGAITGFDVADLGFVGGGEIAALDPSAYLGERNLRPVDRTGRLLLIAAQQALTDSGWDAARRREMEVGLVLGTTFCSVRTIAEFDRRAVTHGPAHASPLDFANCVINAAAGQAAIWHGLRGTNSTLAAGEASSLLAIGLAADTLREHGPDQALLAGGVEELSRESQLGHARAGRLGHRPRPFAADRDGFALAEGAALLMLERPGTNDGASAGAAGRAPIHGYLAGHGEGFAAAAFPLTEVAAAVDSESTRTAVEQRHVGRQQAIAGAVDRAIGIALRSSGLGAAEVELVVLGANGSRDGDAGLAAGVASALGMSARQIPACAPLGLLGESLGASGALLTITALAVLATGVVPGTPGADQLAGDFPLEGLAGATRQLAPPPATALVVTTSSDGHAAALVVFGQR